MWLLSPIAYPVAKLLDFVLGTKEQHTYKKAELKSFLQFHRTGDEPLRDEEITILNGVLELNTTRVESIMTPLKVCCPSKIIGTVGTHVAHESLA
jgi:metal transporter CNNM